MNRNSLPPSEQDGLDTFLPRGTWRRLNPPPGSISPAGSNSPAVTLAEWARVIGRPAAERALAGELRDRALARELFRAELAGELREQRQFEDVTMPAIFAAIVLGVILAWLFLS